MGAKRVLVTGASGFIGRPLVHALVRSGYAVRAATTRRAVLFPSSVDVMVVPDFNTNQIDWEPILRGINFVIHVAGYAHADSRKEDFDVFDRVNFRTTLELAHAAARASVEHFLYISSVRAQTGPATAGIVREQDEARPTDSYGRSKLAAELGTRASGAPFTIFRPVVVYGPHVKGNLKSMLRLVSSPLPLPFAGFNSQRSVLGIDNLISAILFVLNKPGAVGEVYLVADAKPLTIREMISMMRKALGRRPALFYVPPKLVRLGLELAYKTPIWERLANNLVVDTSKLQSLGWSPSSDTFKGFRSMISLENNEDLS